jgi:hypothetical protein
VPGGVYSGRVFTAGDFAVGNPGNPSNPPYINNGGYSSNYAQYLAGESNATDIAPPNSFSSVATALSSNGSVVGYYSGDGFNTSSLRPFVYTVANRFVALNVGNLSPLDFGPGNRGPFSYNGINDQNVVVGVYAAAWQGPSFVNHAFIASLKAGSPFYGGVDLNTLLPPASGWTLTSATGISDAGQIVGYGIDPSGNYSAYELTPLSNQVPEPSVLAFFGTVSAGLAVRAVARRRRER